MRINLMTNFTAMVTADGKTRFYLHRFRIIESPECPCANGEQTVDHLLDCKKPDNEREKLTGHILKEDNWSLKKSDLVKKYLKQITQFANSIDYKKL